MPLSLTKVFDPPRRGIVFREVSGRERVTLNYALERHVGVTNFAEAASTFSIRVGQWHLIDHHHLAHICSRHADPKTEGLLGQIPITRDDLCRIPEVIDPRNVFEFRVVGGMARIGYRREDNRGILVAIEEIRRKDRLALKTLYREKQ